MIQYLIIQLDDTSISFCHYDNKVRARRLITLDDLKAGILFAMKENLSIQFVYPDYELPDDYKVIIETIDHSKIVPVGYQDKADVIVFDDWTSFLNYKFDLEQTYVLRTSKNDLFNNYSSLADILAKIHRLNVVFTDITSFTEGDFNVYAQVLQAISKMIDICFRQGKNPQLNLLTDRMMLDKMNNCNAGWENVTLAPDGRFYICPAFYLEGESTAVGNLQTGLDIRNPQLYRLDYAPLCRICDAYQCKRCIYLNGKTTLEVNTPSHEQCVVSHLERNVSRSLLAIIRQSGNTCMKNVEIKEITYLDPFDIRKK